MLLSNLEYELPLELIAQTPAEPRDAARLLVYDRNTRAISHHTVKDLPNLLPTPTCIIANNSRVRKSRLFATRLGNRHTEILVLEHTKGTQYECMVRGKGIQPGDSLILSNRHRVTIVRPHVEAEFTTVIIDFHLEPEKCEAMLESIGITPLPPYITENTAPDSRYQTVFADTIGSAAAPTAGLHLTPELITHLQAAHHTWETVTLHVGLGTFQPLRGEVVEENKLHHELTYVTQRAAGVVKQAKAEHIPVLAIGTTACRTLESHSTTQGLQQGAGRTDLFIHPGYRFKTVDQLFTNFHLPNSSLLLLVAALIGTDPVTHELSLEPEAAVAELKRIYSVAIAEQYRFFSFGDAMLIL